MKTKFHPPFTQKTFEEIVFSWSNIINRSECGSILNLPKRDQLYRIKQLQDNQPIFKKYLRQFEKRQILYLDLFTQRIEDPIDLDAYIQHKRLTNKKYLVFFILDADKLLTENINLLSYLDSLHHQLPGLSVLYLFQKNITLPRFTRKLSSYTTLYQNIEIFHLFERHDTKEFIIQMEERFLIKFPPEIVENILTHCAGHLWLIKQACRHYAQTRDKKSLFDNEGMELRLKVLWSEFEPEERNVLEKIVQKNNLFSQEEQSIIGYFLKTRHLKKQGSDYHLLLPIFENYIKREIANKTKINLNEKKEILINGIIVNTVFSRRERRLVQYFLSRRGQLIPRQAIASILWQENYTDWALDQAIKRLREKFLKLGFPEKLIKTKKNQGFVFP